MTRMGNLALQRAAFLKAKKLQRQWSEWKDAESLRLIETDEEARRVRGEARRARAARGVVQGERRIELDLRRLAEEVGRRAARGARADRAARHARIAIRAPRRWSRRCEGRVLVHVHCYRADDMLDMLALADEVGFEGPLVPPRARGLQDPGRARDARRSPPPRGPTGGASRWRPSTASRRTPRSSRRRAARVIIHSDSEEGIQRLNQEAGKALASGRARRPRARRRATRSAG